MRKYLYGIIKSENRESFGNIGVGNSEVYTIHCNDVGAAVSNISENYKVGIDEAKIHENALRKIMETHAIIPMSFGIIAKDEAEIKSILKAARMKFKKVLKEIDNKLQINVKIAWDKAILETIVKGNEEIRILINEVKEKADQSLRVELGRKVKSALDERKSEYMKNIQDALEGLSDGFEENKINDPDTLMNASFLVDKKREQEFYDKLEELEEKYQKKLRFLGVGPLPPYDFTKIEVKRIDFNAIEEARKALWLDEELSISEINSAYNLLAREYHPDLHPDDPLAEEKFKRIKNAHNLLTRYCEHYLCSLGRSKVAETVLIQEKAS